MFTLDGADMRLDLPVTLYEAALGAKVRVPTLDRAVELTIPPGTNSGRTFRLKGKGFRPRAGGDLLATVRIMLPEKGDDEFEALMKKWRTKSPTIRARICKSSTRREVACLADQRTHHPMGSGVFTFDAISRPGRREWVVIALVVALMLLFLPMVIWKTVALGQGDVQVFFRAGWAIWTGYPLYEIADHHGWTYHYPPTFALFMGPFEIRLPDLSAAVVGAAVSGGGGGLVSRSIPRACCLPFMSWANACWSAIGLSEARAGYLQRPWALRLGPLHCAPCLFIGDGLARGQPAPVLLFFWLCYF